MHEQDHRRRPFWHLRRRPETVASEVDEELNLHLDLRIAELRAAGLPADAARREALRQFGDFEHTRVYCRQQDRDKERDMQRTLGLQDLQQDIRICLRSLLRVPMLALIIVLTVGLGIGATTTIFAGVYAVLLRPLPYAEPGRLVRIYTDAPPNRFSLSVADYLALQAQQTRFEQVAGFTGRGMAFSDGTVAERLNGRVVTWNYFSLLGITPVLGRDFTQADGQPGAARAIIVTQGFWQQRLGGRVDAIGQPIKFDGVNYALTGVLPPTLGPLEQNQQFFVAAQWETPPRKGPFFITALGRLRADGDRVAAADELHAINRRLFPVWRASYQDEKATWSMVDLRSQIIGDVRPVAASLALAAVALVWLIACTNASNLLIARVTGRRRELAVRVALGASRGRVVRHLLVESALLAIGAAAVGIGLTWIGVRVLRDAGSGYIPRAHEVALDGPVLWMLVALTIASALLFGLVPALHGTGGPVDETLRALGRSSTGSVAVQRLRRVLVGSQFAVATPLLVVAGLLLASLNALARVDLGFNTHNLVSGAILLPMPQYRDPARVSTFWNELQRRVEALPGVTGTAFADGRPPDDVDNVNNFDLEEKPTPPGQSQPTAPWVNVSPEYFRLLGLTLLEGRLFDDHDGLTQWVEAAIVDRAWARRYFPNQSAVGKRFHEGGCTSCPWVTVVGVVSDVKYAGLDKPDDGSIYAPIEGRGTVPAEPARYRYLVLRTSTDPLTVLPAVRQIVRDLDASLPFSNTATIETLVAHALETPRSLSLLVGGFALVALLLSVVGIYGVMAYHVQQHAKDISIRMALGGSSADVLRLIVGQGMRVVIGGVIVGVLAALVLTRLLASLLFGVGAADAFTFLAVTVALLTVAFVACCLPARRAIALEPASVLRNE
jgi:predicted permease